MAVTASRGEWAPARNMPGSKLLPPVGAASLAGEKDRDEDGIRPFACSRFTTSMSCAEDCGSPGVFQAFPATRADGSLGQSRFDRVC